MNSTASPEDLHKLFVQALNSGDLDALVALYAFDGFLMARSGPARGISAIRKALAEYVAMKPTIQLTTRRVVQVEDTALLVTEWRFHGTAADGGDVATSGTSIESLVASRMEVGATSSISPAGSVNPRAENLRPSERSSCFSSRSVAGKCSNEKEKHIVGGHNANGADSSNLGCFLILLRVVRGPDCVDKR